MSRHSFLSDWRKDKYLKQKPPGAQSPAVFLFLEAISLFRLQIAIARGHERLGRDPQTWRHAAVIQIDDTAR